MTNNTITLLHTATNNKIDTFPLTKEFTLQADGTFEKNSFPNTTFFKSKEFTYSTIIDLYAIIKTAQDKQGGLIQSAVLEGKDTKWIKRLAASEVAEDNYVEYNKDSNLLILDIDSGLNPFNPITERQAHMDFIYDMIGNIYPSLASTSSIFQFSSSVGTKPSINGKYPNKAHIFYLMDTKLDMNTEMKTVIKNLNKLSSDNIFDLSMSQPSRIVYVSNPIFTNSEDPMGNRLFVRGRDTAFLTISDELLIEEEVEVKSTFVPKTINNSKTEITKEHLQLASDGYEKYREGTNGSYNGMASFVSRLKNRGYDELTVRLEWNSFYFGSNATLSTEAVFTKLWNKIQVVERVAVNQNVTIEADDEQVIELDERFIGNSSKVTKRLKNEGVYIVKSDVGTGKTQMLKEIVDSLRVKNNDLSVIIPTHRISLTSALAEKFNLDYYKDLDINGFVKTRNIAITLNSLYKLDNVGNKTFDVVVLDEIEQFVDSLKMETIARSKNEDIAKINIINSNIEYVKTIINNAKYVFLADAHITQQTLDFLNIIGIDDDKVTYIENSYSNLQDKEFNVFEDRNALLNKIDTCIAQGDKVYINTDNLADTKAMFREYSDKYPTKTIVQIHSEDKSGLKTLLNPTECKKIDIVITSPAVQTGVSIDEHNFTEVFGIYTNSILDNYDILQGLGRARNVKNMNIYIKHKKNYYVNNLQDKRYNILNALVTSNDKYSVELSDLEYLITPLYNEVTTITEKYKNNRLNNVYDFLLNDLKNKDAIVNIIKKDKLIQKNDTITNGKIILKDEIIEEFKNGELLSFTEYEEFKKNKDSDGNLTNSDVNKMFKFEFFNRLDLKSDSDTTKIDEMVDLMSVNKTTYFKNLKTIKLSRLITEDGYLNKAIAKQSNKIKSKDVRVEDIIPFKEIKEYAVKFIELIKDLGEYDKETDLTSIQNFFSSSKKRRFIFKEFFGYNLDKNVDKITMKTINNIIKRMGFKLAESRTSKVRTYILNDERIFEDVIVNDVKRDAEREAFDKRHNSTTVVVMGSKKLNNSKRKKLTL